MKTKLTLISLVLLVAVIFSCKKEPKIPGGNKIEMGATVEDTTTYTNSTVTSSVTTLAGNTITQHGHCWSVDNEPTIEDKHTSLGPLSEPKSFTSTLDSLQPNTKYYIRQYLAYTNGVIYGEQISIKTLKTGKPILTTSDVTSITLTSAICGGNVTVDSGLVIISKGVCWDTTANVNIENNQGFTTDGDSLGTYVSEITGLQEGVNYFVKAYATNDKGTSYGITKQFSTVSITLPTVSTTIPSNIAATSVETGGNVTSNGNGTVTAKGVCWSYTDNPTLENSLGITINGSGTGEFTSNISGLTDNTVYYVSAYATNEKGTSYGVVLEFTTLEIALPEITTSNIDNLTMYSATSGGNVTSDGNGIISARGICWSTTSNPTLTDNHTSDGNGTGVFESNITGLTPTTQYYARAYATNSAGTSYGNQISFTTLSDVILPSVTTQEITNISQNTASGGGNVTSDGGGNVSARGICWSIYSNPTLSDDHTTNGTGTGVFTSNLSGLTQNTTYYIRAYATNGEGTAYGNQVSFNTLSDPVIPTVTTSTVTNITQTTANCGGNVSSDGGADVTVRGVCWSSTSILPDIDDPHTSDGSGTGDFISLLTDLTPNTFYYVRAYATNSVGTSYGIARTFITMDTPTIPTVTTADAMNITETGATTGGTVHADGGADVTARGVCYSTSANPTLANDHTTDGSGLGAFVSILTGLTPNTQYYVRAYATNSEGTAYGNEITFITLSNITLPTVTTDEATNITSTTATSGGNVTANGGANVTERGVCWSTSTNPTLADSFTTDGSGTGPFTSELTGLTENTTYFVRAYATNSQGTAYGNEITFTTLTAPVLPTVTTDNASNITQSTATSGGNVTSNGGANVTARGVCWSTSTNPTLSDSFTTDGTGTGTFTSELTGLIDNTLYYVRAYATNSEGTAYGNEVNFTTLQAPWQCGDLLSYEGQDYATVLIGTQCWMAENLNYETGNSWCFDNNSPNCDEYGRLYDWASIMNGESSSSSVPSSVQGICPDGWHLPSDAEWTILTDYLGGEDIAGGKMKETGYDHWNEPNTGATNSSGFTALPGGYRSTNGYFYDEGYCGTWWSATEYSSPSAWYRLLSYDDDGVDRDNYTKDYGFSVRCVRD